MTNASLYDEWLNGNAVAVGRTLLERLKPAQQVDRCVQVLERCAARCERIAEVDEVIATGRNPSRWREGHDVFDRVRELTLREEKLRAPDRRARHMLLYVAEISAKTIYNASRMPAPFDADSPWWLASTALHFIRALGDDDLQQRLWRALNGLADA